jgi:hypothetical protein
MTKELQEKLFTLLYELEDYFDYDETNWGKEIGEMVNELQIELLNN